MIGRLIERLFVQVRADMTDLSRDLSQGMSQTRAATQSMAMSWNQVSDHVALLTRKLERGRITQSKYTSEMNRLSSAMKVVAGSYREAQKEVWGYSRAAQAAASQTAVVMDPTPVRAFARSAGQARMQMMNLGYQLNDIGMTLATGMNPMTVMIQQGSQIAQIYGAGQGGITQLFKDLGRMVTGLARRFWPVAAAVGAVTVGIAALTKSINQTTDVGVTMGDTFKAVFQVLGGYVWKFIEGPINDLKNAWQGLLDFLIKWFPKVMNKIIGVGVSAVRTIGAAWDLLPDLWHDTWTAVNNTTLDFVQSIVNLITQDMLQGVVKGIDKILQSFLFAFDTIKIMWSQLPAIMKDAISGAVNWVVKGVESMVNGAIKGINQLIAGLQSLVDFVGADKALELFGFSGNLPTIGEQDLSQWRMGMGNALEDTTAQIGEAAAERFNTALLEGLVDVPATDLSGNMGAFRNAYGELGNRINEILSESMSFDYMGEFFDDVQAQAIENALQRIAAGMEGVGGAAQRAAKEVKTVMDEMQGGLETAADNLAQVFGNAFERLAETGRFSFSDLVKDLNSLIIKSTSELLQQELSNVFQSLATSQGGLGSMFSNVFTSLFGGGNFFGARARGGVEMPWRNFIAGEEGAELISQDGPSGARRVKTAGQTRAAMRGMGGSGPQINIYVQTPDVESFKKSQSQLASRMGNFIARGQRNQ